MPETVEQAIAREKRFADAENMAYELIGQCMSLIVVAERLEIEVDDDLEESIGMRAFCCQGCGWWHSTEELNNLTEKELCDTCLEDDERDRAHKSGTAVGEDEAGIASAATTVGMQTDDNIETRDERTTP
jgi:hypothetical protein